MARTTFIHRSELRADGLSDRAVRGRVAHGTLRRIHRDLFHPYLEYSDLDLEQRWHAAVRAQGAPAAITGVASLQTRRWTRFRTSSADILVPTRRSLRIPDTRIITVSTFGSAGVVDWDGIPLATAERTILDCGSDLTPHQIANVIHQARYHQPDLDLQLIRRLLDTSRRTSAVRTALRLHLAGSAGTRSFGEDRYLHLITEAGIPAPLVNTVQLIDDRDFELDFYFPDYGVVVELDGKPAHGRPHTKRADLARNGAVRVSDLVIIRETGRSVHSEPHGCIARLRRAMGW